MGASVKTVPAGGRRSLRFNSIEEALQDVDAIEHADAAGQLTAVGNWTPGQVLGHVAAWIDYAYDGFPMRRPPWLIRVVLRMLLPRFLKKGMPSGQKIPGVAGGTFGTDPLSVAEGARRLRAAFQRLQSTEPAPYDSPAFVPLSHEDRIRLNLRHAELHLSFLRWA